VKNADGEYGTQGTRLVIVGSKVLFWFDHLISRLQVEGEPWVFPEVCDAILVGSLNLVTLKENDCREIKLKLLRKNSQCSQRILM
jgi:hypothetical protein